MQMGMKFEPPQASTDSPMILDAAKRRWMTYTPKIRGTGYHKLKSNNPP